jgi:predicted ATP-grasp superfamily ATP-dependent carboligase
MFSFNIDTAPLKKEAKETEKALVEHLKQLREVSGETKKLEPDMGTPMYT